MSGYVLGRSEDTFFVWTRYYTAVFFPWAFCPQGFRPRSSPSTSSCPASVLPLILNRLFTSASSPSFSSGLSTPYFVNTNCQFSLAPPLMSCSGVNTLATAQARAPIRGQPNPITLSLGIILTAELFWLEWWQTRPSSGDVTDEDFGGWRSPLNLQINQWLSTNRVSPTLHRQRNGHKPLGIIVTKQPGRWDHPQVVTVSQRGRFCHGQAGLHGWVLSYYGQPHSH